MKFAILLLALAACTAQPITLSSASVAAPRGSQIHQDSESVAPGLVRWHADRQAARSAAQVSGRPLLVFLMLGRLDERFC